MNIEIWLAFVLAAMVVLVVPGPTLIFVISQAIVYGRRAVIPLVAGVILGDFTAMSLSLLGLGAVLAVSSTLFSVLKWISAAYLIYLGLRIWRSNPEAFKLEFSAPRDSNGHLFKSAFIVTALNPKSIVFFVAFLPQFINHQGQTLPQLLILGSTFLSLAIIVASLYAIFAGQLRERMQHRSMRSLLNRCGGSALIGAGIFTAAMQRSS